MTKKDNDTINRSLMNEDSKNNDKIKANSSNKDSIDAMIQLCSVHHNAEEELDVIIVGSDENIEDESENRIDVVTEGLIRRRDGRIEIEYFETELTGMNGACTCISFDEQNPELVTMIRTGSVATALVFEEGKRHVCAYNTEEAAFEICVNTSRVDNRMTERGGEILLDYCIEFRGASTEHTFIQIKAVPVEVV